MKGFYPKMPRFDAGFGKKEERFGGAARGEGSHAKVYAGLLLTMVFWGSAFVASKIVVVAVAPRVGAALRFGLGALLMAAVLFRRAARPIPPREAWGRIAAVGLVGVTAFNAFFFGGLAFAPASDAAVIIPTLSPLFTAAAGMLFLGEPVRPRRVAGLALSIGGALLFFGGVIAHPAGGSARLHGDLLLTLAAGCWAASSILSRALVVRVGAFPATTWTMVVGSAGLLLLAAPAAGSVPWGSLGGTFWAVLVYLVIFPTAIAYILYMDGIRALGPGPATSFMFLAPVSGLLLAALVLGERPTPLQGVGGALMVLGVWWFNRPDSGSRAAPGVTRGKGSP